MSHQTPCPHCGGPIVIQEPLTHTYPDGRVEEYRPALCRSSQCRRRGNTFGGDGSHYPRALRFPVDYLATVPAAEQAVAALRDRAARNIEAAHRLRELAESSGSSLQAAAEVLGVHNSTLRQALKHGIASDRTRAKMERLCDQIESGQVTLRPSQAKRRRR